jgi:hypothetical protein
MNLEQCVSVARDIDRRYLAPLCERAERSEHGMTIAHLRWMVAEMDNGMSENKAMRWLGYIQGVLVGLYDVPLDDMKEASKRSAGGLI